MNNHFELKVPGGKLVVVDVSTDLDSIADVKISGDFFLEPDEAFFALGRTLQGASVGDHADRLQAKLDAALAEFDDVELHGFSTADIALAVRRAVTGAQDFTDYEWEILHPGVLPTPLNVALDELLLDQVAIGQRGPTMRIWDWDDRATVIGSFQSYVNEINQEGVDEHGVTVVRRMSGGGAMFMEGGNCITYSLYAPESLVAGLSYEQSYEYLDRWVIAALKTHGVDAWYVPINDITSTGGKIGGAAQKRRGGAVLHHVTMSYDIDADMMTQVLRIGKVKISDKGLRSAKKRVDPLRRQTGASREQIIDTLKSTFSSRYGAQEVELSDEDFAAGHDLVKTKYATEEWTKRVQ
ncbi:biotin/lipoate A/B protein ligase [Corynebacterium glutamicum ZL-6]|uniref:lipoate--protein ligase family protein n=1 Tax=Corynebacterium TaxID=1716 RepID=UPI0008073466|nr:MULTISPECIES: biotin/lipoate A/B protein ligase family protein [Corynebacterium]ANR62140.1 biotin/lipoate A/B protein ligase [[Brevibacterium] flavum ZL-1]ANR65142.1 biotin/lipoate A/B protein ligase [Corynebacterium glutamicum ZL-6]PST76100.1 biotin/lipoate A/B protein ligase [Corynebacterium glutamicum ZL-2]